MKKLYELGPSSEVAEPSDIPHVPTSVSELANDARDVEAGVREPPTMADFRANLPQITWSFADNG